MDIGNNTSLEISNDSKDTIRQLNGGSNVILFEFTRWIELDPYKYINKIKELSTNQSQTPQRERLNFQQEK